ncbi:MAG TPA: hypothetical protein VFP25_00475 [Nitrososphaeraceae archaeon]|nr:hypothetical protein [Nitrososphaeraceae archaeon]
MINEFEEILFRPQRKLVVSSRDINLSEDFENKLFLLIVDESKGSAGGRGGGSGHRKITRVMGFEYNNDKSINKVFDTNEEEIIEKFEIPYSAVAMDITLSDRKQFVVQGIVDPFLVQDYWKIIATVKNSDNLDQI